MRRFLSGCLAAFLLQAGAAASASDVTAIVGVNVVHPDRDGAAAVERDRTVIVADGRIREVGSARSVAVPAGATRIDARGKWLIPGLIDSHVHFFQSGNLYTRPDGADFGAYMPYAKEDARNRARLPATFKVWLANGVTSVVDIGGPFWNFEVREAARRSEAAPRVVVAGPLVSMVDRVKLDLGDPPIIKITTPEESRALVRRELARKPDFIKVWFIHRIGDDLAAQEAIVKAAADEAHAAGVRLAVHATELVTAKASLRVGADFLVHSVDDRAIDDEFIALAKRNNALYCPTLFVGNGYQYALSGTWKPTELEQGFADPQVLATMGDLARIPASAIPERVQMLMRNPPQPRPSQVALDNLRKAWNAGIPVVMGTDAGNIGTLHGPSVFREMEYMAQAGLTPLQILRSATTNGAKTMRMEKDLGAIEPGRFADLVILDADPLASVSNLGRIHAVMKEGRLFNPRDLMGSLDSAARRIDELMRKSGLDTQIAQIPAQMKQGVTDSRDRTEPGAKNRMTDAEYARMIGAMDRSFAPERMRSLVAGALAKEFSVEDEEAVLGWLSSDLGARITRLEEKSGEPAELAAAQEQAAGIWDRLPPARSNLMERLADSSDIGEAGAAMMINMALASAYGAAMTMPGADERAVEPLRRQFELQRPKMAATFKNYILRNFAYMYRELDDDELARYVAFSESPAGRRFSQATIKALSSAFAQASLDLGRTLGRNSSARDIQS